MPWQFVGPAEKSLITSGTGFRMDASHVSCTLMRSVEHKVLKNQSPTLRSGLFATIWASIKIAGELGPWTLAQRLWLPQKGGIKLRTNWPANCFRFPKKRRVDIFCSYLESKFQVVLEFGTGPVVSNTKPAGSATRTCFKKVHRKSE